MPDHNSDKDIAAQLLLQRSKTTDEAERARLTAAIVAKLGHDPDEKPTD